MIYDRIKKLCKEKEISVNQLEKELEISKGSLCKIDKSSPSNAKMNKIAEYFNISIDYLQTGEEPQTQTFSDENAMLVSKIRKDAELSKALLKYFKLSDAKKKHIIDEINMLSEV